MFGRASPISDPRKIDLDPRKIDLDSIFYLNDYSSTVNLISQIYQIGGVAQGVLHQTLVELRKITHDTHYREKNCSFYFSRPLPWRCAITRNLAARPPLAGHAGPRDRPRPQPLTRQRGLLCQPPSPDLLHAEEEEAVSFFFVLSMTCWPSC